MISIFTHKWLHLQIQKGFTVPYLHRAIISAFRLVSNIYTCTQEQKQYLLWHKIHIILSEILEIVIFGWMNVAEWENRPKSGFSTLKPWKGPGKLRAECSQVTETIFIGDLTIILGRNAGSLGLKHHKTGFFGWMWLNGGWMGDEWDWLPKNWTASNKLV